MADIAPTFPERKPGWGWCYKSYVQIGTCETPRKAGGATLYGIYGTRGDELFVQRCGHRDAEGCIWGVSLLSSSMDMESYFWSKREHFQRVRIDGETGEETGGDPLDGKH